jgi:predicted hotdog family 3-hydroxylacyl-ACP dehydratase
MQRIDLPAESLLPHRPPMLLIDRALEANDDTITASAVVHADTIFVENGRLPAHALLEYMAQTMGLWACWQAKQAGLPPPVGFLLGTRSLKLAVDSVAVGSDLALRATRIYISDEGLAQFDCEARLNGELIACAKINAFQPKDATSLMDLTP